MMTRIIFYICPGHQCSEFVPWLINNSPDMKHNGTWDFPDNWTRYESSWGVGYEPMDSHWTFNNITNHNIRKRYKEIRSSQHFDPDWMKEFIEYYDNLGTHCIFFNIDNPDFYEIWVNECREWFANNYPDVKIEFFGHIMNLKNSIYPSLFFLKEGYILDEKDCTKENFLGDSETQHKLQGLLETKVVGRCQKLIKIYNKLNFDQIFQLRYIEDRKLCRQLLGSVVTLPDNFDDLYDLYYSFNQVDPQVDVLTRILLNRFDVEECHVPALQPIRETAKNKKETKDEK